MERPEKTCRPRVRLCRRPSERESSLGGLSSTASTSILLQSNHFMLWLTKRSSVHSCKVYHAYLYLLKYCKYIVLHYTQKDVDTNKVMLTQKHKYIYGNTHTQTTAYIPYTHIKTNILIQTTIKGLDQPKSKFFLWVHPPHTHMKQKKYS